MPRGSDGTFTLVGGTIVQTGDTLLTTQHNPPFQDVASALTDSLSRTGNGGMQAALAMGGNKITGLDPGTDPTDAATVSQIVAGSGAPVGAMMDYAGAVAPSGWLICAGQAISRSTYAELFGVVGTLYGAGNGTTTFNIPDCRGRATVGQDVDSGGYADRLTDPNSRTLGATGGSQTVTLTTDQIPSHTHTGTAASSGAHSHSNGASGIANVNEGVGQAVPQSITSTGSAGAHTHDLTINNAGGGGAHSNVQPVIVFPKIIKVSSS